MTDELKYKPSDYRNMVRMSSLKHILVEGEDDKRCLMYLIEELFGERDDIEIHGAYQISSDIGEESRGKVGNREKVEEMSKKIGTWGDRDASRFVGL